MVGRLGDDPGRRAEGARLRGTGRRAECRPRPRSVWCSGCCSRRRPRWAPTPTRAGLRAGLAGVRRPAAGAGPRRGAGIGSPARVRQRAVLVGAVAASTSRCWPTLLDNDPAEMGLAGLDVDTDLRWRIVTALATGGDHRRRRARDTVHRRRGAARPDGGRQAAGRRRVGGTTARRRSRSAAWTR